jgi:enamine deaminase RidA (YjgF/YER057c/UK114 family)
MTTRDDNFVAAADAMGFDLDMADIRPSGRYVPVVMDSHYVYVAGQIPRVGNLIAVTGAAGRDVSLEQARDGARICVMRLLTLLQSTLGSLDRVLQVMRMNVYVQSARDFTLHSEVADAASDLLVQVLEDAGAHTRTSVGTYQLPKNATVEIDLVVAYEAEPLNMTTMTSTLS